jgi:hypothetical protein
MFRAYSSAVPLGQIVRRPAGKRDKGQRGKRRGDKRRPFHRITSHVAPLAIEAAILFHLSP